MWTPDAIAKLQHSVRGNRFETYKEYAQIVNDQSRRHMTLRGLFEFKFDPAHAIPVDEVEPAAEIVRRFATGAMSLGSISTEAHTTLAVSMNRIGGKSNTGEGGEDPARYRNELRGIPIKDGTKVSEVVGAKVIEADYELDGTTVTVVSCYVHSGEVDTPKQDEKWKFLDAMSERLPALRAHNPLAVVVGDLNVGHDQRDIKNWKGNVKRAGFLPRERAYFSRFFGAEGEQVEGADGTTGPGLGWVDVGR